MPPELGITQFNQYLLEGPWQGQTPEEWIFIQPTKDPNHPDVFPKLPYPEDVKEILLRAVNNLDIHLTSIASESDLVGTIGPQSESYPTWHALIATAENIAEGLESDQDNYCVGAFHGVAPIWNLLKNIFLDQESLYKRISSTIISGYKATGVEFPRLFIPLFPELTQANLIYFLDDVVDSAHTTASFIAAIQYLRRGKSDMSLVERLSAIGERPFDLFNAEYDELIKRLHAERIVLSAPYYKNKPFLDRLKAYIKDKKKVHQEDDWTKAQDAILDEVLVFEQHDWLMGRGLDTGESGLILVDMIRDYLAQFNISGEVVEELLGYIEKSTIRVGSLVERIIVLKNKNIQGLMRLTAKCIGDEIISRVVV